MNQSRVGFEKGMRPKNVWHQKYGFPYYGFEVWYVLLTPLDEIAKKGLRMKAFGILIGQCFN